MDLVHRAGWLRYGAAKLPPLRALRHPYAAGVAVSGASSLASDGRMLTNRNTAGSSPTLRTSVAWKGPTYSASPGPRVVSVSVATGSMMKSSSDARLTVSGPVDWVVRVPDSMTTKAPVGSFGSGGKIAPGSSVSRTSTTSPGFAGSSAKGAPPMNSAVTPGGSSGPATGLPSCATA